MAGWALLLLTAYLLLAFGVRSALQKARTGSTGFKGTSGNIGSAEWIGGTLFVVAIALGALAPIADLMGVIDPIDALDTTPIHTVGFVAFALGIAGTLVSQAAMGGALSPYRPRRSIRRLCRTSWKVPARPRPAKAPLMTASRR